MKIANTFLLSIYCIAFSSLMLSHSASAQKMMLDHDGSKRTLALVIGISDYKHLNSLQFAHKDAEDFANFLTAKDGMNLPKDDVVIFTNDQATQSNVMYKGFNWLNDELNEGDEAFIFFSGHGDISDKDEIDILKTGYLLTHESEKDKYESTAVPMVYFLKQFHLIAKNKKAVIRVIMDVCHAGIGTKPGGIINLLEMGGHLDPDKQIIITSCRYDQYSWEYEALQNGCFSYFFLQGLKGAADLDGNKEITLKELEKYSMENVERYVKQRNNTYQFPEFKGYYSHRIADVDGQYQPTDIAAGFDHPGNLKQGTRKGVNHDAKTIDPKVESLIKEMENKGLSNLEIQSANDLYLEQPEKTKDQRVAKRKMKRSLVATMIEKADKTLTAYFDKEGEIVNHPYFVPASEYYLKSAELLGKKHFLYNELLAKYFFMEALRLKALNPNDPKVTDYLNSSLTLEPIASYTLNELGNIYFAKGELETALEYYQKANMISPAWGKNIVKANKSLQQKQTAQQLFATKSPYNAIPNSYETASENRLSSNNSSAGPGNTEDNVFHIQLAAASKVNRAEFKTVEDLGPVNPKFNPEKNLINTWLGPFDSEEEAKIKLKKAKERGFKDAFLVETPRDSSFQKKLDEKKAEVKKEIAAAMPYQVRIASVKAFNKAEYARLGKIGNIEVDTVIVKGKTFLRVLMRFNLKEEATAALQKIKKEGFADAYIFENQAQALKSEAPGVIPSSYENTQVNPAIYKIRVATVSKLVENQFSNLETLGHIYMDVLHDRGLIRVSLGDYSNKTKALEILDNVKKLGYKDAFIQQ